MKRSDVIRLENLLIENKFDSGQAKFIDYTGKDAILVYEDEHDNYISSLIESDELLSKYTTVYDCDVIMCDKCYSYFDGFSYNQYIIFDNSSVHCFECADKEEYLIYSLNNVNRACYSNIINQKFLESRGFHRYKDEFVDVKSSIVLDEMMNELLEYGYDKEDIEYVFIIKDITPVETFYELYARAN